MRSPGRWICPRCHRKIATELVVGARGPVACPGCRETVKFVPPRLILPRWAAGLRRMRRELVRNWSAVCLTAFRATGLLSLLFLFVLWFDSSGLTRIIAVGCLAWAPWCAYRLALARWPEHTAQQLPARVFWVIWFFAVYAMCAVLYVMSARSIDRWTTDLGKIQVTDTCDWLGRVHWRDFRSRKGITFFHAYGPVSEFDDWHGLWCIEQDGRDRACRWHWHGEIVTEQEWHNRARLMGQ